MYTGGAKGVLEKPEAIKKQGLLFLQFLLFFFLFAFSTGRLPYVGSPTFFIALREIRSQPNGAFIL